MWWKLITFFPLPFFFLQRYEEAAQAFREVLKLDNSCPEAAQELMRVQITQIMVCNRNTCWWLAINGGGSWENGVTASKCMDNWPLKVLKFFVLFQEYGFTQEQSLNALIIHGTVKKAVEVLSKLNRQSGECLPVCDFNIKD